MAGNGKTCYFPDMGAGGWQTTEKSTMKRECLVLRHEHSLFSIMQFKEVNMDKRLAEHNFFLAIRHIFKIYYLRGGYDMKTINKPQYATIIEKDKTNAFIELLMSEKRPKSYWNDCLSTKKTVSSSTMAELKRMCNEAI